MGFVAVTGWALLSYKSGSSVGTEIPIGIISGLTGALTGKKLAENAMQATENQSHAAETLGKVSEVASQGQQILNAVNSLSAAFKDKGEGK
jgi:hypothetical protein